MGVSTTIPILFYYIRLRDRVSVVSYLEQNFLVLHKSNPNLRSVHDYSGLRPSSVFLSEGNGVGTEGV